MNKQLLRRRSIFQFFGEVKLFYKLVVRTTASNLGMSSKAMHSIISAVVTSALINLIYIPFISIALFIVYMGHYHFFSYDFFIDGLFGMKLFALTGFVILLVLTVAFFLIVFFMVANRKKKNRFGKVEMVFAGVINVIFIALALVYLVDQPSKVPVAILIAALTLFLAIYLGGFVFENNIRVKVRRFVFLLIITIVLIVMKPDFAVGLLKVALRGFGSGGEAPVEIVSDNGDTIEAKLILRSPHNVYFIEAGNSGVTYQSLSKLKRLKVIRKVVNEK